MTLESIKEISLYGGGILIVLMTVIQVTPIKINPWSWLARCIGNALNKEVLDRVKSLSVSVEKNKEATDMEWAELRRTHILRFGDEIRLGKSHSEEHFNHVLDDIHKYDEYCNSHPNYKNDKAVETIKLIKHTYQRCLAENKFL